MAELQMPDWGGAYARGQLIHQQRQEAERQNALAAFMQENGGALMAGDQNALAAYAAFDPAQAFTMKRQLGADAMDRERLDLTRRSTEASIKNDDTRLRLAQEEGARQAQQLAATLSAAERTRLAAEGERKAAEAETAWGMGPEAWDRWNDSNPEFENITFEDAPMKIAAAKGAVVALKPKDEPEALRTLEGRAAAGGLVPGSPEYQEFMLKGPIERTEDMTQTFRPATPEEAQGYGATAGQIDTRTNRFYPADARDTTSGDERKAAGMYERMQAAEQTLDQLAASGARNTSLVERGLTGAGVPEGYALSGPSQQVVQAQRDWVRAKLRLESGAVIGDEEMAEEIRTYFPQPGEEDATIEQKRVARQQAMEQVRTQGGRAVKADKPSTGNVPQLFLDTGLDEETWNRLTPEEQAVWGN